MRDFFQFQRVVQIFANHFDLLIGNSFDFFLFTLRQLFLAELYYCLLFYTNLLVILFFKLLQLRL